MSREASFVELQDAELNTIAGGFSGMGSTILTGFKAEAPDGVLSGDEVKNLIALHADGN